MKHIQTQTILKEVLWPLFVFAIITAILTYPVSLNLGSMIVGRPFDDAFEYVWYLSWYKNALIDAGVSPLFQPDIFYPSGWNLSFAAFPPIYPTIAVPFTAFLGAVRTYNLYIMFTYIFAAFGAYRLVRALGGNMWGALFAGIAFTFYPQRIVYLGGHLNFLTGSMWLPWLLFAVVRAKQTTKHRTVWMAFSGFCFALSIAGSWHFLFLSGAGFILFSLVYLWGDFRDKERRKSWLRPMVAFLLTTSVIIGPFLINAFIARQKLGVNALFSFAGTNGTGVSLERFLIPSAMNPLFWNFARIRFPLWNGQDAVVHFGYIVLLLAGYALWRLRPWSAVIKALLIVFAMSSILMLGLTLHWMGSPLSFTTMGASIVQQIFPELILPNGEISIPMPAFLLYVLIPPFRTFHSFSRWGLVAMLSLSILSGLGLSHFISQRNKRLSVMFFGCAAIFLLLFEFNTQPLPDTTNIADIQRGVDTWLAEQPEQKIIIEYPLNYTMKGQTLYYSTIHGQKMIHGAGSLLPPAFTTNLPILNQWPNTVATDLLGELGVDYAVLNVFDSKETFEEETLPIILANDSIKLVKVFEENTGPIRNIYVFEIN